ncbi:MULTISPECIES: hypothetical protein [unclassified Streptomyces]|uniref:hypothetical protein n=1 Tax=unclassified Streptomyces TaxID=2593676 RepID=UPI002E80E5C5|nr:hypothetical protein [Streptomyces sp. NBC_00589]WTI42149.1 hypothetical protein OIC96_47995 [Streptomyces sp. NBC_00775]WUB24169.1 hypothetical protein OHA51_01720 [Streptomyces sp. NBC_00589]
MSGHALVLSRGIAGLTAAVALAPHLDTVTIAERDTLPDGPVLRRGVLTAACLPRDATMVGPPCRATDADQVAAALAAGGSPRTAPAAAPRGLNRGVQQP